jgi:ATP-dependent DNA ligase
MKRVLPFLFALAVILTAREATTTYEPVTAEAWHAFGVEAAKSLIIDGEAIVVDQRGLSAFDLLRSWRQNHAALLCAFDLVELDGQDLRGVPLENRKSALAELIRDTKDGIAFNKHFDGDGIIVFRHACALGCEGCLEAARLALSVGACRSLAQD